MNSDTSNSANPYESPATVDDAAPINTESEFDGRFHVASIGLKILGVGAGTVGLCMIPSLISQFTIIGEFWSWRFHLLFAGLAGIAIGSLALIGIPRPWRWLAAAIAGVQAVSVSIMLIEKYYPVQTAVDPGIVQFFLLFSMTFTVWLLSGIIAQTAGRNGLYFSCLSLMTVAAVVGIAETFFGSYVYSNFAVYLTFGFLLMFSGLSCVAFATSHAVRRVRG